MNFVISRTFIKLAKFLTYLLKFYLINFVKGLFKLLKSNDWIFLMLVFVVMRLI